MTAKAKAAREATLGYIEAAQSLLYKAAQTSCDLRGWADEYQAIGDHADATKSLWHRVNSAHKPTYEHHRKRIHTPAICRIHSPHHSGLPRS